MQILHESQILFSGKNMKNILMLSAENFTQSAKRQTAVGVISVSSISWKIQQLRVQQTTIDVFSPENRIWYFMQIVFIGLETIFMKFQNLFE